MAYPTNAAFIGVGRFKGYWNAATNSGSNNTDLHAYASTALFVSGALGMAGGSNGYNGGNTAFTASVGDYWQVTTAGTTALDGVTNWEVNDFILWNTGSTWARLSYTDTVASVVIGDTNSGTLANALLSASGPPGIHDGMILFKSGSTVATTAFSGTHNLRYLYTDGGHSDRSILALTGTLHVSGGISCSHLDVTTLNHVSLTYVDAHGSSKFGNSSDDTHQYTGSLLISGTALALGGLRVTASTTALDTTTGSPAIAYGHVTSGGTVRALGGAFAHGRVTSGTIEAVDHGAFVHGYAKTTSGAVSSSIIASNQGAFAGGFADSGAKIEASGRGSFAHGWGLNATSGLTASGHGAIVLGYAASSQAKAGGTNSVVIAEAGSGYAEASGTNAIQIGRGLNGEAYSIQFRGVHDTNAIRLKSGVPTEVHYGDIFRSYEELVVNIPNFRVSGTIGASAGFEGVSSSAGLTVGAGGTVLNGHLDVSGSTRLAGASVRIDGPITANAITTKGLINTVSTISSSAGLTVGVGATILNGALSVSGTIALSGTTTNHSHQLPAVNNVYDLGSAASRYRNIYTGDLHLKNHKGDWTIIEEKDYLCVINNLTGKRFKMVLQPIE